jgi:acyl-CoA synthetase (AMP-forming)/AMP-acid ligase II
MPKTDVAHADGPPLEPLDDLIWIGDIPALGAARCPDRLAVIFPEGGHGITYKELDQRCNAFVAYMRERGVEPGDRIAYLGKNNDLFIPVLLGAVRSATIVVPLNWRLTAAELAYQLKDSQPKLLLFDPELSATATQAAALCGESLALLPTESAGDADCLRAFLMRPARAISAPHERERALLQLYTSGTTGRPKGVMISQYALSLSRHAELLSASFTHLRGGSVILSAMPNSHIGGISWVLMGLVRLGTVILTADASPGNLLRLLREYRAEHAFIVPTVIRAIVDELRSRGEAAPPLAGIYYGAMAMSASLLDEALRLLDCAFVHFFGMTEISGSACFLSPKDHDPTRPELLRTVGTPYAGTSLEIRGPDRRVLKRNELGEIWIKSPSLMLGYNQLPEKTAEAVVDGWYASGDGGYLDDGGYLCLTDRIKDMIVSGGENVYPAEVEEAIRRHPAVLDAAVVAVPDDRWGEMVAAAVELRPGKSVSTEELRGFLREQIAGFKCPKAFSFIDVLPRTVSGKVQRAEVRRQFQAHSPGA